MNRWMEIHECQSETSTRETAHHGQCSTRVRYCVMEGTSPVPVERVIEVLVGAGFEVVLQE